LLQRNRPALELGPPPQRLLPPPAEHVPVPRKVSVWCASVARRPVAAVVSASTAAFCSRAVSRGSCCTGTSGTLRSPQTTGSASTFLVSTARPAKINASTLQDNYGCQLENFLRAKNLFRISKQRQWLKNWIVGTPS
jgi:hypothetical protein